MTVSEFLLATKLFTVTILLVSNGIYFPYLMYNGDGKHQDRVPDILQLSFPSDKGRGETNRHGYIRQKLNG